MREPILKYYDVAPNVTAFSTTRHGGFSTGSYAAFNVNHYCGDDEAHVRDNTELLCRKLRVRPSCLVMPHQVHGIKTACIDDAYYKMSAEERKEYLEGVDALVTKERLTCIGVSTADCVPILLYDAEHQTAAAIHAGWRGTQQRIAEHVVEEMRQRYGTDASRLSAVIGPSIGPAAFEVGQEVYDAFRTAGYDMEQLARMTEGKWHIDLWQANVSSLLAAGVLQGNIQVSGICTFTHSADYFSARKLTVNSGRILSGIIIR